MPFFQSEARARSSNVRTSYIEGKRGASRTCSRKYGRTVYGTANRNIECGISNWVSTKRSRIRCTHIACATHISHTCTRSILALKLRFYLNHNDIDSARRRRRLRAGHLELNCARLPRGAQEDKWRVQELHLGRKRTDPAQICASLQGRRGRDLEEHPDLARGRVPQSHPGVGGSGHASHLSPPHSHQIL